MAIHFFIYRFRFNFYVLSLFYYGEITVSYCFNAELYKSELRKLIKDDSKYNLWFDSVDFRCNNEVLEVSVKNNLFKHKLQNLFHFSFYIAAKRINYPIKDISYIVDESQLKSSENQIQNQKPAQRELFFTNNIINRLDPRFEFETFIVDETNKFAYTSAINVSRNLGVLFNPFFIYGDSGFGKSHIAQSIAKYAKYISPYINLKYFDAAFFKNLYLDALRKNNMIEFRERFRKADLFIIENIEVLEDSHCVQEECFHIYNDLTHSNNQLIITSTIAPEKLTGFMPRLISRLKTGLVVQINNPAENLKVEYIKNKTEECELFFPVELIKYFLVKCNTDSLKLIDNYLNKIIAYLSVTKKNLDTSIIDEILTRIASIPDAVTISDIQKCVAFHFGINCEDLRVKFTKSNQLAKHIAMYMCRELTNHSLKKIASDFGKADKSAVIYAYNKMKDLVESDEKIAHLIKELTSKLFNKSIISPAKKM